MKVSFYFETLNEILKNNVLHELIVCGDLHHILLQEYEQLEMMTSVKGYRKDIHII